MLLDLVQSEFTNSTKKRGFQYFHNGQVVVVKGDQTTVHAIVVGSEEYRVQIACDESGLRWHCDCIYFLENGACKHLWAVLNAAQAKGYLSAATPEAARNLVYDVDPDDYWSQDDPFVDQALQGAFERFAPVYPPGGKRNGRQLLPSPPRPAAPPPPPRWIQQLNRIQNGAHPRPEPWPSTRQILYAIDVTGSKSSGCIRISLFSRDVKKNGDWTIPKQVRIHGHELAQVANQNDREILAILAGTRSLYSSWSQVPTQFDVLPPLDTMLLPRICGTGNCVLLRTTYDRPGSEPLEWDNGGPWDVELEITGTTNGRWRLLPVLRRGEERLDLSTLIVAIPGLIVTQKRIVSLRDPELYSWISQLCFSDLVEAPREDGERLIAHLLEHRKVPRLRVPEELGYEEVRTPPIPCLMIRAAGRNGSPIDKLRAALSFNYAGRQVDSLDPRNAFPVNGERSFLFRDTAAESAAADQLKECGLKVATYGEPSWELPAKKLPAIVQRLLSTGWHVEAEGKAFRPPGSFNIQISSGLDWFELHAEVKYGETVALLPQLLEALRKGEKLIPLGDGTYGVLPEEWLTRFAPLASLGSAETEHVRFHRSQSGLLDALLAAQPEISYDETFARARAELQRFDGVRAADQPPGFAGQLRKYQQEGLGWMQFLEQFGFGGCLADDMGVGKTAQVLAMLESRRELRQERNLPPSLAVIPKSLVFNWKQEAARFTPNLRVYDHTGSDRSMSALADCDLVVTTYGILRRDITAFKDLEFDYVILDEAQAIKNSDSESAKAVRLLRGRHRLALSGTPVQNHLGDLWSLFEFLNPGMLGKAGVFKLSGAALRNPSDEMRELLSRALRPFILRRTKEQVAPELPPKTEQVVFCEMEPEQRALYNELREFYRAKLLGKVKAQGLTKSKIQVLEALLRLRQAACHPGLLDQKKTAKESGKFEFLLNRLNEVIEEGHKALVFSQFTSLLAILRKTLDKQKVRYEYLDGSTEDRETPVSNFQSDPDCRVFLISLKAGGLGLNLVAADYVFILDPWWNPAVEAQAVDRAHRIGQTQHVFAYRLISKDTVEEKILELQASKRDLSAAILGEDNALIRDLKIEDLQLLLS